MVYGHTAAAMHDTSTPTPPEKEFKWLTPAIHDGSTAPSTVIFPRKENMISSSLVTQSLASSVATDDASVFYYRSETTTSQSTDRSIYVRQRVILDAQSTTYDSSPVPLVFM